MMVDPYAALVGVDADNPRAFSEGKKRVDPGNLDNSFMWTKLNLTVATDRKTDYGEPIAALRSYVLSPFADAGQMPQVVERVLAALRQETVR